MRVHFLSAGKGKGQFSFHDRRREGKRGGIIFSEKNCGEASLLNRGGKESTRTLLTYLFLGEEGKEGRMELPFPCGCEKGGESGHVREERRRERVETSFHRKSIPVRGVLGFIPKKKRRGESILTS